MESFSQQLRVHSLSPGQRGVEPGSLPLGTSPSCSIILITRTLMNMKTWCPSTPTFPPHVASDINGCLGAGSSCFLGHQIQRLRGKSLERPPSPSGPITCLSSTVLCLSPSSYLSFLAPTQSRVTSVCKGLLIPVAGISGTLSLASHGKEANTAFQF